MGDSGKMDTPLIVNTLAFWGYDLPTAFSEIAGLGVRYVEPAYIASYSPEYDDAYFSEANADLVCEELARSGLQVIAVASHMDLGQASAVTSFSKRMHFAARLGAHIVLTNSSISRRFDTFLTNLRSLSNIASELGIVIALENPGDGKDSILPCGSIAAKIIEEADLDPVRLNYDFSNVFSYSKGNLRPEEDYEEALPWAVHFHLKDICPTPEGWEFTEIGGGVIDYPRILTAILKRAPSHPMSIEMPLSFVRDRAFNMRLRPIDSRPSLDEICSRISRSLKFLTKCLSAPG
jgi:sugar phosphate isomerase/epimerase